MAKRKKKIVFAEHDGVLYVKVEDIMSALVMMVDAIPVTRFGKGSTPYMTVEAAIEWNEKEAELDARPAGYRMAVDNLRRALENFRSGKMIQMQR